MAPGKRFWLMKSEPDAFSIDDLKQRGLEPWSGVRNYQARNFMRDQMQPGDLAFLYHSSCPQPGVYGLMQVAGRAYPDPTQFDRKSPYFDAASTREQPRWHLVDVKYRRHLKRPILLAELRANEARLKGFKLFSAVRLSVMPVAPEHWERILALENRGQTTIS
jgi:predicted RNA-binding protein with PUA-like domain